MLKVLLTLSKIPSVDWIVQFDPPDVSAFNKFTAILMAHDLLHRIHEITSIE